MSAILQPTLTLSEIYGPDLIFSQCVSPNARAWLPRDATALEMLSGGALTVTGNMSVLCASGVSTPEALQLLRDAGFRLSQEIYRYHDAAEYVRIASVLCRGGKKFALQYIHPQAELAHESYWVHPATLSFLNNKANLAELVAAHHLPTRRILSSTCLTNGHLPENFPLVIKAVTNESSGCGVDVAVCSTASELHQAAVYFRHCTHVVAEDFLPIVCNLCLNYAVTAEGCITYLGCAEQVCDANGKYHGNWIDPATKVPMAAMRLGTDVARAGFARGFWGCLGIDMAVLDDGRVVVFDLNFRINGSTRALLLAKSVRHNLGTPVIRLRDWKVNQTYREMLNVVYTAMGKGTLLPLGSYDPAAGGYPEARPQLTGLILGATRAEVLEHERELADMGLEA